MILTPSLRNAAETAPYMHDGSDATLRGHGERTTADLAPTGPRSRFSIPLERRHASHRVGA
jgi:cytochrome c peroxidase